MTDTLIVRFPNNGGNTPWIPDPTQIEDSGNILLAICGQVLDQTPAPDNLPAEAGPTRGAPYQRRVLTTGQQVVLIPNQDGQLVISVFEMALGRAGEQRFQFFKGTMGAYAQKYVRFVLTLARKSPTPKGGIAPRMQDPDDLVDYASLLWDDAWIVWSALLATALGGVKNAVTGAQLSPAPLTQDNLLIGPVTLSEPGGGLARATIEVWVQY